MTTKTLFNISDDIRALDDLLIEIDGEVTDTTAEEAIDNWLAELGEERDEKLDQYAWLITQSEGYAENIKAEIDRLKRRQKAMENKATRLKERLELFLKTHGIEKIQTAKFTFALQKSGGKPKVILDDYFIDHAVELPEGLRRVKFEPDLSAIREKIEAGDEYALGIARLETPQKKLRIR